MRKIAFLLSLVMALVFVNQASAQCTDPPVVNPVNNVTACSFQMVNISFTGTPGATFQWTNTNPGIGIPSLGFGNINRMVFSLSGQQVATITVTPILAGCPLGQPITFTVTVSPEAPVVLPEIGTICRNAPPIQLPTSPGGISGNWSGIGVSNNVFNPSFSLGDPIQLLFAPNPGQCASFNTITVEFYPPLLTYVSGLPGPYCAASDSANLNGVILQTNGVPAPGFWSGSGMISDFLFSPSEVGPGNYNLTFTTIAACPDVIPFTVIVEAATIPTLVPASLGPYCVNASAAALPVVQNQGSPVTGEWSPPVISTAVAGSANYTFSPDPDQGCIADAVLPIIVTSPPTLVCAQQNPVSAPGANDGTASLNITGGTPDYTVLITGAANINTSLDSNGLLIINNLSAGNYSVTVNDANGCQQTCSFTINDPLCNIGITSTVNKPSCFGGNDGSITLQISNGAGPLTFTWNNPALNGQQNPGGLMAGTYVVTITDGSGCTASTSIVVTNPPDLQLSCSQQQGISGSGMSNGIAAINITGGSPGYSITWSGPVSGAANRDSSGIFLINNLAQGSYTVTVTDSEGCAETCVVTIAGSACNLLINAQITQPTCSGSNNGSINLTVTNSFGALNFNWNVDALDGIQNPTNLPSGVYFVTVTDQNNCTATASASLVNPLILSLTCAQQSPVTTANGSNGVAALNINGGTPGYTISWSGAASGSRPQATSGPTTLTNLVGGTYNVTIADANNCTTNCSFTIAAPTCALTVTATGTNITCHGAATGSINVTATGGNAPLTYTWSQSSLNGIEDPSGLIAGTYTVTVTDAIGCTASRTITLTQAPAISVTCAQQTPATAIGSTDGSGVVTINNGLPGYTIAWSGAQSGSTTLATNGSALMPNLRAGNYTLTVTDSNNCTQTCSFTIGGPTCALAISPQITHPTCNGASNGSISITVTNSNGTITYDWSNNALDGNPNPSGLGAGTYGITVSDALGCNASASIVLNNPPAIALSCSQQQAVSTVGGNNGIGQVTITNGSPGYTISWSGPSSGTTSSGAAGAVSIPNLSVGTYTVTVTDINNCSQTCQFTINGPSCNISLTATGTNPTCNGSSNGTVSLSFSGANGTPTFTWNPASIGNVQNPTGLSSGTYLVTLTDAIGCTGSTSIALTQPAPLTLTCAQQSPTTTVGGNQGVAALSINGGTSPYNIQWTGPVPGNQIIGSSGNFSISGLLAGTYNLTLTDQNNCTQTCSFTITSPTCNLSINVSSNNITCNGAANGSINVTVLNNNGAPSFNWNDNTLDGIQNPSGLIPGTYSLTVTDAIGCTASGSATITQPAAISLSCAQLNPVTTVNGSDGSASIAISNGVAGYDISWTGPTTGNATLAADGSTTISGLREGNYMVTVTDDNGCTQMCSFTIQGPVCNLSISLTGTNPTCNNSSNGSISVSVNNSSGALNFDWNNNALDGIQNPSGLSAGTYSLTVTDAIGCIASSVITLTNPAAITLTCSQLAPTSTVGGSNGSARVIINNGSGPYTIAWSGPANGSVNFPSTGAATITSLLAGSYSVTVTDALGCFQTCSFTINGPACSIQVSANAINPRCTGQADGSILVNVNFTAGSPSFAWSNPALNGIQNPAGLSAGTYTVSVTDAIGCTASTSITLIDPAPLTLSCTQSSPATTVGGNQGAAAITIAGGTAGYFLEWSGPLSGNANIATASTFNLTNLTAGTYSLSLTDDNGCQQTCSFTIEAPNCNITLDLSSTDVTCNGGSNGSISVSVSNSSGTLDFDWNDDVLDGIQNVSGIGAGNYSVTVTDAIGCTASANITITQPAPISLSCAQLSPATTVGGNQGEASITVSNGAPGYTIAWTGPASGNTTLASDGSTTLTGLLEGNYSVTVTDNNGCQQTCAFSIAGPVCNIAISATTTPPTCHNGSNGSINVSVTNSSGALNYDWSENSLDGLQNPSGLSPGTFSLTVTDAIGCSATANITITNPAPISLVCAQQSPATTVGGNDGSATITIANGSPGYTITWAGPSTGTTTLAAAGIATISDLSAGTYNVTVTDINGCQQTCSFNIGDPNCDIQLFISGLNPLCTGESTGNISLFAANAVSPNYAWSNPALNGIQNPTGLSAGTYTVTVTDAIGCTASTNITLIDPAPLTLSCAQTSPATTVGGNQGAAAITIAGGTAGYYLEWSGPLSGNANIAAASTFNLTNLTAGTYNLTLTDDHGCQQTCSFTIAAPICNISLSITASDVTCNGGNNGSISVSVTNSSGTLDFDWNDDVLDGIQNVSGISAGNYSVTVTDAIGCTATANITISQPAPISLSCAQLSPATTVGGNQGEASITISNGAPGYTIAWTGPASGTTTLASDGSTNLTGLLEGSYSVTVTDNNGCQQTCAFSIAGPVCNIAISATTTPPTCHNGNNGSISVSVNNSSGTLIFDWSENSLDGLQNPSGLSPGTYGLTVTDAIGCTASANITIINPAPISLVCAQESPATTVGGSDGSATITIANGSPSYTIAWSGPSSGTTTLAAAGIATINGLSAGTYNVTVTDINGCEQTCSFNIGDPNCDIQLFIAGLNPLCNGQNTGNISLFAANAVNPTYTWSNPALNGIQNPTDLPAGTYTVTVTDAIGCTASTNVTLTDPPLLSLSCTQTSPTTTVGGNQGAAAIIIAGGTAGYFLEWSGPLSGNANIAAASTFNLTNLTAGTYSLTLTDDNGCQQTCALTIEEPNCNITLDLSSTNITCNGGSNGSISVSVSNSSGTLDFDWNDDVLNGIQNVSGISAGNYSVTVTDAIGCTASASLTISQPAPISLSCAQLSPATTVGGNQGEASITVSNGAPGYTIAWTGPASGNTTLASDGSTNLTGLLESNYSVTVTDNNGCQQTCAFSITGPICNIAISATTTPPTCHNGNNGSISLIVTNSTGTISYDWNENSLDGLQNPTGLSPGTYGLTVTDAIGCTATANITITNPAPISLVCAQQSPATTVGGSDGSATITIANGTPGYSITWTGPSSGTTTLAAAGIATISDLSAGTYNVTVTDINGCQQTCSFNIGDPSCNLTLNIAGLNPRCNGANTGAITLFVGNDNGSPTFTWSNPALNGIQNPTDLPAGTYTVTVTDAIGCTASTNITLTDPPLLSLSCTQTSPATTVGGNQGAAAITIAGGTAGYFLEWSGPLSGNANIAAASTFNLTNLTAGTYNLTLTDDNGCQQTCALTIEAPNCNITLDITASDVTCNGGSNGSISVSVTNSSGTLDFDWNDDVLDGIQNVSGISAGNYSVTVTDAIGCTASANITISQPAPISLSCAQLSPATTVGGNQGEASITISNGAPGYTIAWTGPASGTTTLASDGSTTLTGLLEGNYSVTVTDNNGCQQTCAFSITGPICNIAISATTTPPACNNGNDGSISVSVNNSSGNLIFDWSENSLDGLQNPSGLSPGTYGLTVTDAIDCTATANITITNPAPVSLVCAQQSPATTVGGSDGSATITIANGSPGYTITWAGPSSGITTLSAAGIATISDLSAGTYNVTVTDNNGCQQTCSFNIANPSCNLTLNIAGLNPRCNGTNTGAITLGVANDNGSPTFTWSNPTLNGIQNPTELPAGTYFVTVTDAIGCTASTNITLTEPTPLSLNCTQTSPATTVGGNQGAADITIVGGTAGYFLEWSGPLSGNANIAAASTFNLTNLTAGTYSLTLTDDNGCQQTCALIIEAPNCNLNISADIIQPQCEGIVLGSIAVMVTGNIGTSSIDWDNDNYDGQFNISGLSPGTFSVTITDAAGCTADTSFTLVETVSYALSCAQINPAITVGGSEGAAAITLSGGSGSYVINWSGPINGSGNLPTNGTLNIDNLREGSYTVSVSDEAGCIRECQFIIEGPICTLQVNLSGNDPSCFNQMDGSISSVVQNSNGALIYAWNLAGLNGEANPQNLAAGTYTLTVTDAIGCTATSSITLNNPTPLSLQCSLSSPVSTVGGTNGVVSLQTGGGTAPYIIAWSGPSTGSLMQNTAGIQLVSGLREGSYTLTITDANGCTTTCDIDVEGPICDVQLVMMGMSPSCHNGSNGSINLSISNTSGALLFDWNVNTLDGQQNPSGLIPGIYAVTVTDAIGCTASTSVQLSNPAQLQITCSQQSPAITVGGSEGIAAIIISNGTAGYTLSWSGPVSGTQTLPSAGNHTINNLPAGNYALTVTDANGCTATCSFTIDAPVCEIALSIMGTNPRCNGSQDGSINLTVSNSTGNLNFDWNNNQLDGIQNPTGLTAGTYTVLVTDAIGCTESIAITLIEPTPLLINCAQQNAVSTVGGSDGRATISLSGGTAAYTIIWTGPVTGSQLLNTAGTATISGLLAGLYAITVTDANGCQQTCSVEVEGPVCNIALSANAQNPSCNGGANGAIQLTVSNSTAPLQFVWSNPALNGQQNPNGLSAGNYSVTVTDAIGCTATSFVSLQDPAPLTVSASGIAADCFSGPEGQIRLDAISGGQGPFTARVGNENYAVMNPLPLVLGEFMPGNYTITLTDNNNCTGLTTIIVPQPLVYTLSLGPAQEIFLGDSILLSGQASFDIASVRWTPDTELSSPGSAETYARPLNTTTYQLEVSDSIGCSATASIRILVNKQNRIFIPNAFSPNGDNINDIFMVFSDASVQEVISMRIFDRWGNQLFESGAFRTNDPQFGWDGNFRGQALDAGMFVYSIELRYIDGRTEIKSGEIMLMR